MKEQTVWIFVLSLFLLTGAVSLFAPIVRIFVSP